MPIYALGGITPTLPSSGRYFIAPGARVIGRVRLHEEVSIWFGAVLRGDNDEIEVGAASNIQDNAVVHVDQGFPTRIGAGCTIGHHATLHGCNIGDNSLVGMGATVLNGAVIGENSLVGAGALVTEGKAFEPGSLIVGSPARAIRRLDEAAIALLRQASANYTANWRRYRLDLTELDDSRPTG